MTKPWFKAKNYGWGWYPASWQGWLILAFYVGAIIRKFRRVDSAAHSGSDALFGMVVPVIILTIALIGVCYATGEKPEWHWAGKRLISKKN